MLNLVVLISGNGGNLQSILDHISSGKLKATIKAVISDNADAFGLERARKAHINTLVCERQTFDSRKAFETALRHHIDALEPDYVVLAGFMRVLSADFVQAYPQGILNIHPSLLPKYKGLHTHQRVLEAGDKQHGATVHVVTPELDSGQLLAYSSLEVLEEDTVSSLQQRVFELEHRLYPQVLIWLSEGQLYYDRHTNGFCFNQKALPAQGICL